MDWQESRPITDFSWLERLRSRFRPLQRRTQALSAVGPNEFSSVRPQQVGEPMNRQALCFRSVTYFPQSDSFLVTLLDGRAYQLFGASLSADPTFDHHSVITGVRLDPEQNDHFTVQFASGATLQVSGERVLSECEQRWPEDNGRSTPVQPLPVVFEAQHVRWLERQVETLQAALLERSRPSLLTQPLMQSGTVPVVCPHCHKPASVVPTGMNTLGAPVAAEGGTREAIPEQPMPEKSQSTAPLGQGDVLGKSESRLDMLRARRHKRMGIGTDIEESQLKEGGKEAAEQVREEDEDEDEVSKALRSLAVAGTKVGLRKAKDTLFTSAGPALRRGLLALAREAFEDKEEKARPGSKDTPKH